MIKIKKFSLFCFLTVLAACAVGPDYQRPDFNLPKSYQQKRSLADKDVNLLWWEGFNDVILTKLINNSVDNNKSVQQALSRINQARAAAKESFAQLLPGFKIRGGYNKSEISGVQFGGSAIDFELYDVGVDAAWEIDLFGRLRRGLEAKNADYQYRVADLQQTLQVLISDLAKTYFQLRGAQEQLRIAEKNLKLQEETLRIVQVKSSAGAGNELDLARSQAQFARTKSTLPPLRALVKSSMHRLAVLSGKYPGELYTLLNVYQTNPYYQGKLSIGDLETLLERRPDLMMAESQLKSATALIGYNTAELYPIIQLAGAIGFENTSWSNLLDGEIKIFSYGPQISWKPLDNGQIRARIHASKAAATEALSAYEETVLIAVEEVENALVNYHAEKKQGAILQQALEASEKAYSIASSQYKNGALDFLSVLDVQARMLEDENSLFQNKQRQNTAIVELFKALGGGWQNWNLVQ